MDNAERDFFLEITTHCAVFGRGDSFILIPLGCGETPSLEVIVDAAVRGFALCGIVGLCEDCQGIREWVNPETLGAAFTVQLARSRYFAWLRNRDKAVRELAALYELHAASLTLFAAGGGIWEFQHLRSMSPPASEAAANAPVDAQMDLFNAGTFRGANDGVNELQSVMLPTALVRLAVTPPRFRDAGQYEVLVSKDKTATQIVAKSTGRAQEMNGRVILDVTLDLRAASNGSYFLATVRGDDAGAYHYPLTIK